MVMVGSIVKVADNSGAIFVKCISAGKGYTKRVCKVGELLRVCVKKLDTSKSVIKKKKKYLGLLISSRIKFNRFESGTYIKWHKNRILILNDQEKFLGTRVYGAICKEMRGWKTKNESRFSTIISYSNATI